MPGSGMVWDGWVDPYDRSVSWATSELDDFCDTIEGKVLVFANAMFDLAMLASVGIVIRCRSLGDSSSSFSSRLPKHFFAGTERPTHKRVVWVEDIVEVQLECHTFDNRGPKSLDELTRYYLGLYNRDDRILQDLVKRARNRAKKWGAQLGVDAAGKRAPKADYWMVYQNYHRDDLDTNTFPDGDPTDNPCGEYGLRDTFRTLALHAYAIDEIKRFGLEAQYTRQMRAFPAFYRMQTSGLPIHEDNLQRQIRSFEKRHTKTRESLIRVMLKHGTTVNDEPNPNSDPQIKAFLFQDLDVPVLGRTKGGGPRLDKEALEELLDRDDLTRAQRAALEAVQAHRKAAKSVGTIRSYDTLAVETTFNGRRCRFLFGSYHQAGTGLTRCSARDPNLQNVPKRDPDIALRDCFGPPPGYVWVSIDYSQVELRLFAKASGDPQMSEAFAKDQDIHAATAAGIYGVTIEEVTDRQRGNAKNVNFGILYGAGEGKIIRMVGSVKVLHQWRERFPNVTEYIEEIERGVRETGQVFTLHGYRLWVAPEPIHKSVNCVVQGSAGDVAKEAMADVLPHTNRMDFVLVNQVHDELNFLVETKNGWEDRVQAIANVMGEVGIRDLDVDLPVDTDIKTNHWGEK